MTKYPCPICKKRICDSEKELYLAGSNKDNSQKADVLIKCQNCKCTIAIEVTSVIKYIIPHEKTIF